MIDEILKRVYTDIMQHLGQPVVYTTSDGRNMPIIAFIHEPDKSYDIGASENVEQVIEAVVKAEEITPRRGDYITVKGRKYKIFSMPKIDPSVNLWRFFGLLEDGEWYDEEEE